MKCTPTLVLSFEQFISTDQFFNISLKDSGLYYLELEYMVHPLICV